jgi:hypothetical protein
VGRPRPRERYVARRQTRRAATGRVVGAGAVAVGTAAAVAATSPNWGWGAGPYNTGTGYNAGGPYRGGVFGARAAYYGGAPYAAGTSDANPWYAVRAYYTGGPWYGYNGWNDYAAQNAIRCTPGSRVKGENGLMYRCQ